MAVGIEAIHFYAGVASVDIKTLFEARGLDLKRFDNLMLHRKSVALPCEDPVTFAVNAAKPLLDALSEEERNQIELLITATESGIDFGKSLSTYIHDQLKLSRQCRLFEIKQACYGGTAALQMAAHFIASGAAPGAKALVIASDITRAAIKGTYIEPSQGAGAVAMIVSDQPRVLELDFGANGFCSYEVMDTCRPTTEIETGDSDLSLLSYLDCLEQSFRAYEKRVEGADFATTFDFLAFHTPFAGMVKGAHRMMMRKIKRAPQDQIDADFERRVVPSLRHCVEVGNIYSATLYLALCGLLDDAPVSAPCRVGLFSYGSGCSSEFFSGIITPESRDALAGFDFGAHLRDRVALNMEQYDQVVDLNLEWVFGTKDRVVDNSSYAGVFESRLRGRNRLVLTEIKNYHREYAWV
jgi:polyketide biosynthesis 3-hydroxy-3-methylglutaryl-CoA synthase-like enzyme PksG